MAFIITKDYIKDETAPEGTNLNAKGVMGPSGISENEIALLSKGEGHIFKMYDGDGELYYRGRYIGDKTSEQAFEPLERFGTPNAGCTYIEYLNDETGKWERL